MIEYPSHVRQCREKRQPSPARLERSQSERPFNLRTYSLDVLGGTLSEKSKQETVLYLAYGSNLCFETFQGRRGIKPISQINVLVPELHMTFDLPGIPYTEPCFANSGRRDATRGYKPGYPASDGESLLRPAPQLPWKKGLVGVVYEVTHEEYAHIIATEGGGMAYADILVDCYPLTSDPIVPDFPTNQSFKAHTLFAGEPATGNSYRGRPDPTYAQPSARYLKLITDGGREHELPEEYQTYLESLHPYTITTMSQKIGRTLFMGTFGPFMAAMFALMNALQDKKTGRIPVWLAMLMARIFWAVWFSYDNFFKKVFGDGERTIGDSPSRRLRSSGLEDRLPTQRE